MVTRSDLAATLAQRSRLTPTCYSVRFAFDAAIPTAVPGQFVMLRPEQGDRPFWGRAYSIAGTGASDTQPTMELMIKTVGPGTALWEQLPLGTRARIVGPLGVGFPCLPAPRSVALVAGGIGLPPLLFAAHRLAGTDARCDLYLGAATAAELIEPQRCRAAAEATGGQLFPVTDDGTAGEAGLVTEALQHRLAEGRRYTAIWACGPMPMLRAATQVGERWDVPVHVALEERMACGVGVCLGCIIPTSDGAHIRTCSEGPVVDGSLIDWETAC
ncbi:MAG: dihydroorotate dehydrogenase electron transfer subunit [Acidobacteria bacterium]|jgi:dihydroorotate dehydrogenase electron transfer subunit|nr:dihydroorotate dehydrogenase electron transfer subunit [Acidobacteriota bacterium]